MRLKALVSSWTDRLCAHGVAQTEARAQVMRLAAWALHRDAMMAYSMDEALAPGAQAQIEAGLRRRLQDEPIQYIVGEASFYGRDFFVSEAVLIPRFDTETVVEAALAVIRPGQRVLDLCTGSGCIGVTLFCEAPSLRVTASDISPDALLVAQKNAARHRADIQFVLSDCFDALSGPYDVIVCNPPYIKMEDRASMSAEVLKEPSLALFAGDDGLHFYRRFFARLPRFVTPGGYAVLEMGDDQLPDLLPLIPSGFQKEKVIVDLDKKERGLVLKKAEDAWKTSF